MVRGNLGGFVQTREKAREEKGGGEGQILPGVGIAQELTNGKL